MRIADVLPLTPLQKGLLFHTNTARDIADHLYAVQVTVGLRGVVDVGRLADAVQVVGARYPHVLARFSDRFEQPVQIVPADARVPWRYLDLAGSADAAGELDRVCAAERAAVCDLADAAPLRVVLARVGADEFRFVLTNHHIVLDGWSLPILLGEVFAVYQGRRLGPVVPFRRFVTWLAGRDEAAGLRAWAQVLGGLDAPTLVGPPDRVGVGSRGVLRARVDAGLTAAVGRLARVCQATPAQVLQAVFGLVLASVTGQRDVVFGTTVSGRPAELVGAESMVGLLINTVPVRVRLDDAGSAAELLGRLRADQAVTLEHQHVALPQLHRLVGQEQLFDTLFVYENYPLDPAALTDDGPVVTGVQARDLYHYPLAVQAIPGDELELFVQYRTDVFGEADVRDLVDRFRRLLAELTAHPDRAPGELVGEPRPVGTRRPAAPEPHADGPLTPDTSVVCGIFGEVLDRDDVGVDDSFFDLGGDSLSAMRAVAAVNRMLRTRLPVSALFRAPTPRTLSRLLDRDATGRR